MKHLRSPLLALSTLVLLAACSQSGDLQTGLELVRVLARQRPELRCLVVTGHVENSYLVAARAAGAVGLVVKDDPDEVLGAVRRAINPA